MDPEDQLEPGLETLEEPETPVTPEPEPVTPPVDIEAIKAQARAEALAEFQSFQQRPPTERVDPFAEAADLVYTDPHAAFRMVAQATRDAVLQEVQPHLNRVNTRDVIGEVAGDLDPAAQRFIGNYATMINPQQLDGPLRELLRNAAENVSSKARANAPEPTAMIPAVRVDNNAYAAHVAEARAYGYEPCSRAEFAEFTR